MGKGLQTEGQVGFAHQLNALSLNPIKKKNSIRYSCSLHGATVSSGFEVCTKEGGWAQKYPALSRKLSLHHSREAGVDTNGDQQREVFMGTR